MLKLIHEKRNLPPHALVTQIVMQSFCSTHWLKLEVCTSTASGLFHLKFTVIMYRTKMRKKSCLCQNIYGLNCISICLAPAEFLSDKKSNSRCRHYQQLACCLGTLCIILVLGIIAVSVYRKYENIHALTQS